MMNVSEARVNETNVREAMDELPVDIPFALAASKSVPHGFC
jgi:hypothetical protein